MILIFEMSWSGTTHAPSNSATIQIVARAFPEQEVRVHANPSHLDELRRDCVLTGHANVNFVPISISPLFSGSPANVALARLVQEFRTVRVALEKVPPGESCLVYLISTTATGPFAASWAARLSGRRAAVQIGFHGNLNDASGWRPRNPLKRAFDTRSALTARYPVPLRFLVLEEVIRSALSQTIPAAALRMDVMPLPVNPAEMSSGHDHGLTTPVRIGFVGLGTSAKGMDIFLDLAVRLRARWGAHVEFVHVGRVAGDVDPATFAALAHPPATDHLPREEFRNRLAGLHYVLLPFRRGYYDFSASGALLDAVTWLKPVITTRVPLTEQFFADYGEIGFLCDNEKGLDAAVEDVLSDREGARYALQVDAMRRAAAARDVGVLAKRYRSLVRAGFPTVLQDA